MLLLETCLQASFLLTRQLWPHVGLKTPADYRNWEWSSWQSHQLPVVTYETVSEKDPISFISPCVFWETRGEDIFRISSVQFSRSVVSDSLRPHESQHATPPCPSPTPGVYSNPCPSSWWCHPTISSSVVPFSSCLQSLPASGSFPMSQLFACGGQSTE